LRFGAALIATAELKLIEIKGKRSAGVVNRVSGTEARDET
jgi:hypothetical protein